MGVVHNILRGVVRPAARSVGVPKGDAISWSSYWATLISATVENAVPTNVVLTFPSEGTSVATDITATVNGVARNVSSASWTGGAWTVVLASAVEYGDVVVMTFKEHNTTTVTNNVLSYTALLTSMGDGTGVSTIRMQVSANITVTLGSNAKFYSDAGGTADESATWTITSGALRTIYLKCTTGTATMTFSDVSKIIYWGTGPVTSDKGWETDGSNAPEITLIIGRFTNLTKLYVGGWAKFIDALPTGLRYLYISATNFSWGYDGPLPSGLSYTLLNEPIDWSYSGALTPTSVLQLNSSNINWTGLDLGDNNISTLNLFNYRTDKMSSADMVTFLTNLTNRTGTLPATITINDYADYASPPQAVVDAVAALKTAKSITTVNLGA